MNSSDSIYNIEDKTGFDRKYDLNDSFEITGQLADFLDLYGPVMKEGAFSRCITIQLKSAYSEEVLRQAYNKLIAAHIVLGAAIDLDNRRLQISDEIAADFKVVNISTASDEKQAVRKYAEDPTLLSFDYASAPLHRLVAFKGNDGIFNLNFYYHHSLLDEYSLLKVLDVFSDTLKGQDVDGMDTSKYLDFLDSESKYDISTDYIDALNYWKEKCGRYNFDSYLPYLSDIENKGDLTSSREHLQLNSKTRENILSYCREHGFELTHYLITVFEMLVYRRFDVKSVLSANVTSVLQSFPIECPIAFSQNFEPVIANKGDSVNFKEYITRRQSEFNEDKAYNRVGLARIRKFFNDDLNGLSEGKVQVSFNFQRLKDKAWNSSNWAFKVIDTLDTSCVNDMNLRFEFGNGTIEIDCDYRSAALDKEAVKALLVQYKYLLESLPLNDQVDMDNCDLYDIEKIKESLASFNSTAFDCPEIGLIELISKQVERVPANIALRYGGINYSYKDLNAEVEIRARALYAAGIRKGDLVGVMLDRVPDTIFHFMAILCLGGAYMPIDKALPMDRIQYMLDDSGSNFLLTDAVHSELNLDNDKVIYLKNLDLENPGNAEFHASKGDDLAYVLYTSGSTGKPKGVPISTGSLVNLLLAMQVEPGFREEDVLLSTTTFSFDISVLEMYLPMICGATVVLGPTSLMQNAESIISLVEEEGITVFQGTPATYKFLLNLNMKANKKLRLFCGGEPLGLDLAKSITPHFKELWNLYGPTETCIWSSVQKIDESDLRISVGRPINNTKILILDERHRPVPVGMTGEIAIAGIGLTKGYLNKETQNKSKFITHPFDSEKRIYLTGDLGYIGSDLRLYCKGRKDHQVKIRGYRIETGEIENVLMSGGNYREVAVVPVAFSDNDLRLVAYLKESGLSQRNFAIDKATGVQFVTATRQESEQVRELCLSQLPDYMVPAMFVYVNSMPLSHNAKTDRLKLAKIDLHAVSYYSDASASRESDEIVETWNETERQIKLLWEKALQSKDAGKHDDFFEAGGHSLVAIELMHEIESKFKVQLPLSALFNNPNIEGLAKLVDGKATFDYKYLVPVKPEGSNPPLFIVHGAGLEVMVFKELADSMDAEQPVIGIQAMGLQSDTMPPERLEEIASEYIREIKSYNNGGAFYISGFSAGSLLAFEICRQLEIAGEKVALCAIFDYSLESTLVKIPYRQKLISKFKECIPRFIFALKMLVLHPSKAIKYQRTYFKLGINSYLMRSGLKKAESEPEGNFKRIYKLMDHFFDSFANYQLKPYNGQLHIFRSKIKMYYLNDNVYLGWKPYALKGIVIHEVEGDHDNMLIGENGRLFARTLQKVVNQILDNSIARN